MPISPSPGYNHPVTDLIRVRSSIRSYNGEPLPGGAREELEHCCRTLSEGPLGSRCRFRLIDRKAGREGGERVGAYGTIRGAPAYLAGAAREGSHALEDYGYLFEQLVLKATDLELGTCWLGGVFSRSAFARAMDLRQEEILPAVSPVGVPSGRRGLLDQIIRWGAGSKKRKPWSALFFEAATARPLSTEQAGRFASALEMVRLAPSASNRQPWRIWRQEGKDRPLFHFFLLRSPGYRSPTPLDLQRIDIGIAMAHFDLALENDGLHGSWIVAGHPPQPAAGAWQKCEYVISWRADW